MVKFQRLNEVWFGDVLRRCIDHPEYRIGIAFSTMRNLDLYISQLRHSPVDFGEYDINYHGEKVAVLRIRGSRAEVVFYNGSVIRFFVADSAVRGTRFDEILIDNDVNDDFQRIVLRGMLKPGDAIRVPDRIRFELNGCARLERDEPDDRDDELDKFLSSFKLLSQPV